MLTSPLSARPLGAHGLAAGCLSPSDGREVVRRQAEWEREIETLDQKEMELHQSQLRLIRDQTAIFVRDLSLLQQEVATVKDTQVKVVQLPQRVDMLERLFGDSADRQGREWEAATAKLGQLAGKLSEHQGSLQEREAHHASLNSRVDFLEKLLGESADRHTRELEAARTANQKVERESKQREAHHASMQERLVYMEKLVTDSVGKHAQEIETAHARLEHLHGRLERTEAQTDSIDGLKKAQQALANHHEAVRESQKAMAAGMQGALGEHADRHTRAMTDLQTSVEKLQGQVTEHRDFLQDKEAHHAEVQRRVDEVHAKLAESAKKHEKELDAARNAHTKLTSEAKSRDAHHSSVAQRLGHLEKEVADWQERSGRDLEVAHTRLENLHGRLGDHHAQLMNHATLQERVAYVEKLVGDQSNRQAEELAAAHAKVEQMRGRVTAFEAHASTIESVKKVQASHTAEKQKREAHQASMQERVEYLEKTSGLCQEQLGEAHATLLKVDSRLMTCERSGVKVEELQRSVARLTDSHGLLEKEMDAHTGTLKQQFSNIESVVGAHMDKQGLELEAVKANHAKLSADGKQQGANHSSIHERLNYLEGVLGDSADTSMKELASANSKLDQMHGRLAAVEAQNGALDDLKKSHASLTSDKAVRDAHGASMQERLDYLEKVAGELTERCARESASTSARLEAHHGRLASCEKQSSIHGEANRSRQEQDKVLLDALNASLQERIVYLERVIGDAAEKQAKELEALKAAHGKLASDQRARDAHGASMAERLGYVESVITTDKHAREIAAAHAKVDQLASRVQESATSFESHVRAVVNYEKDGHDAKHASVKARVDMIERLHGEVADSHARGLEELRAAHTKMAKDAKLQQQAQASTSERLDGIERRGDLGGGSQGEVASAHAKLEHIHQRLSTCEKHGHAIEQLKIAHNSIVNDKAALDRHHSALKERVDFLEGIVGDSADKHDRHIRELDTLRTAHSKHSNEAKQRDAHHASVAERLDYLEKLMDDSFDKHAQELRALHGKHDQVHARVSNAEAQASSLEGIRQSHANLQTAHAEREAHHATMGERMEYLEKLVGDSAEKHARELDRLATAHQSRHDELHMKVAGLDGLSLGSKVDLSADLAAHHAPLHERLELLEQVARETAEKLAEVRSSAYSEGQLRAQHYESIAEHLSSEKRTREVFERTVQSQLASERKAREQHESLVADQFGMEKQARERHQGQLNDVLTRERDARERSLEALQSQLAKSGSLRESVHGDLHSAVVRETAAREQQHQVYHEALQREKAARTQMEDSIQQEKAERARHHETVNDRVDSLQRTVNIFDSLIRKEMDERTKENRRIWDAVDNHTHDLSTQVVAPDSYGGGGGPLDSSVLSQRTSQQLAATSGYMAWSPSPQPPQQMVPAPLRPPATFGAPAPPGMAYAAPPQMRPPSPRGGQWGMSPSRGDFPHESIMCGHTRYGGERGLET